MSREIELTKSRILASGTDDWVHDMEACYAAREAIFGDHINDGLPEDATAVAEWTAVQERQAFPVALEAVKELVRDGLVQIGAVTTEGFVAWEGTLGELESCIDRLGERARFPLMPGDLFWLSNTSLGDEKAGA